jgi:hypothetical protein
VRSGTGERRLVVPLMFIESETADRLSAFARERDATFRVRGHVAADGGRKFFEPSRCIFIHRVKAPVVGQVLSDPNQPHVGFKPHQLAFTTPKDEVARGEFRSAPFYAVILKTGIRCRIAESERLQAQALFPANKVFSTHFGCEDSPEEHVTYANVDAQWGFLAAHAGANEAQAQELLARVKGSGRFPGANIRRMQAVLVYP